MDRPPHPILSAVARVLNDSTMGFLAITALGLALLPGVFPQLVDNRLLLACDWMIVALFAVDYVTTIVLSPQPTRYAMSWEGLVDLFIVVAPFFSLLPSFWSGNKDLLRSSPALRVLRLLRAITFGARERRGDQGTACDSRSAAPRSRGGERRRFAGSAGPAAGLARGAPRLVHKPRPPLVPRDRGHGTSHRGSRNPHGYSP